MRITPLLLVAVAFGLISASRAKPARGDGFREIGRPPVVVPESAAVVARPSIALLTIAQVDLPANLEGDRGTLSRERTWTLVDFVRPLDAKWTIRLGLEFEVDVYHFSESQKVYAGTGPLLNTAIRTRVEPGVDWRIDGDWMVGGDVGVETTAAVGASWSDAVTLNPSAYIWHRFSPSFALRMGFSVVAALEDSSLIVPYVAPDNIDAASPGKLRFEVRGTGGHLGYAFTPVLTAGISGAYDRRDWRLPADDRAPSGIARDIRIALGLYADLALRCGGTLGFEAGAVVSHEFELADRHGTEITRISAEPSAYFALSFSWKF